MRDKVDMRSQPQPPGRARGLPILLAVTLAALAQPALAQTGLWDFTPRVSASLEVTDNVRLAPRGQEDSDLIGTITPGFTVRREGQRAQLSLNYSLSSRFHLDESSEDRTTHNLAGRGRVEVIPDAVFVDAAASRTAQAASLLGPIGIGGTTPRDNLTETSRYSVSPYWIARFGDVANQQVRYTYDQVRYHRSTRPTSDAHSAQYTLDSGPAFGRPFWQIAGSYRDEEVRDGVRGEFASASATAGYRFGRSLRLFVTGGREFNDFETDRDDDDGSFWLVGAGWAPTSVTNIDATYGERFFGKTGSVAVTHRSRRASYRLSFVDDISSTRGVGFGRFSDLADLLGLTVEDMFEQFTIEELNLLLALNDLDDPVVTEGFFRTRSWRAGWTYDTGRSTFGITAFHSEREAESRSGLGVTEDDRTRYGVNGSWRWALGPRTDATFSTGFSRTEFEGDREDDLWNFRAGIGRDLGSNTRASLAYRHQRRDSNEAANEYRENGVVATVTRTF